MSDYLTSRSRREPGAQHVTRARIFWLVALLLLDAFGCRAPRPVSLHHASTRKKDLNIELNGRSINYYAGRITDVQRAMRRNGAITHLATIDGRSGALATFVGSLDVVYSPRDGRISSIRAVGPEASILGRIRNGSTLPELEETLAGGTYVAGERLYYFLLDSEDGSHGDGYRLLLDEGEKVIEIQLGRFAYGP